MWEKCVHGSNDVQTKEHGRKLCAVSSHSWNSWNNFHEQAFELFIKIIFFIIFTIGFVSNFIKF
jgi:hypothetical protein